MLGIFFCELLLFEIHSSLPKRCVTFIRTAVSLLGIFFRKLLLFEVHSSLPKRRLASNRTAVSLHDDVVLVFGVFALELTCTEVDSTGEVFLRLACLITSR